MSYNTLEQANEYIMTHYVSDDPVIVQWLSIADADKTILLNKAYRIINALPLTGRKMCDDQEGAFPRCPYDEVPVDVMYAEVELALALSDRTKMSELAEYRQKVDYGVSSYRLGNLSETFVSYAKSSLQMRYGLVSSEAERLLAPWLRGGFNIE